MEVNRLTKDELIYEVGVRGGSAGTDEGIDVLRGALRELLRSDQPMGGFKEEERVEIESELLVIESKLTLVQLAIQDIKKGGKETSPRRIKTLLYHLNNRISYIFPRCQGGDRKKGKEIYRNLKQLSTLFSNSGEGVEYQSPDICSMSSSSGPEVERQSLQGHRRPEVNVGIDQYENCQDVNTFHRETRGNMRTDRNYEGRPQLHKWNITFSGSPSESVNAFIVRIEELAIARGVSEAGLLLGAVELFEGQALLWFRSVRNDISSWEELKVMLRSEFLPLDFEENLLQEIRNRKQGMTESVGTFIACMLGLYDRLSKEVGEEEKLSQIKRNLAPYYLEKLALQPVLSIKQLKSIGKELDLNKFRIEQYEASKLNKVRSLEPDLAFNKTFQFRASQKPLVQSIGIKRESIKCWNCDQNGHRFSECKLSSKIFCHRCGYKNEITRNCPNCRRGNRTDRTYKPQRQEN